MTIRNLLKFAGIALAAFAVSVHAAGLADRIEVDNPYVRLAPPGAKATGAFMVLRNAGEQEVLLVKAASGAAKIVELHDHINDGGVMRMRQVKEIRIPAKGETHLKPGSFHVMLIDMKAPLQEEDHVVIKLEFADGSSKEVHAIVKRPTAAAMPMQGNMHKH